MRKRLFLVNAALLVAHEVDAAYWHEWDMFRLPGGVGLFVVLHVALALVVLLAFERVVTGRRGARALSLALGSIGLLTAGLHGWFLVAGRPEFRTAVSLTVLGAIAAVSLAQLIAGAAGTRR